MSSIIKRQRNRNRRSHSQSSCSSSSSSGSTITNTSTSSSSSLLSNSNSPSRSDTSDLESRRTTEYSSTIQHSKQRSSDTESNNDNISSEEDSDPSESGSSDNSDNTSTETQQQSQHQVMKASSMSIKEQSAHLYSNQRSAINANSTTSSLDGVLSASSSTTSSISSPRITDRPILTDKKAAKLWWGDKEGNSGNDRRASWTNNDMGRKQPIHWQQSAGGTIRDDKDRNQSAKTILKRTNNTGNGIHRHRRHSAVAQYDDNGNDDHPKSQTSLRSNTRDRKTNLPETERAASHWTVASINEHLLKSKKEEAKWRQNQTEKQHEAEWPSLKTQQDDTVANTSGPSSPKPLETLTQPGSEVSMKITQPDTLPRSNGRLDDDTAKDRSNALKVHEDKSETTAASSITMATLTETRLEEPDNVVNLTMNPTSISTGRTDDRLRHYDNNDTKIPSTKTNENRDDDDGKATPSGQIHFEGHDRSLLTQQQTDWEKHREIWREEQQHEGLFKVNTTRGYLQNRHSIVDIGQQKDGYSQQTKEQSDRSMANVTMSQANSNGLGEKESKLQANVQFNVSSASSPLPPVSSRLSPPSSLSPDSPVSFTPPFSNPASTESYHSRPSGPSKRPVRRLAQDAAWWRGEYNQAMESPTPSFEHVYYYIRSSMMPRYSKNETENREMTPEWMISPSNGDFADSDYQRRQIPFTTSNGCHPSNTK